MIAVNSYFSGAGLMDTGLLRAGLDIQESIELDAVCCETLRRNFGHTVSQRDISRKLAADEASCEVMVGTYPCTHYSPIADIHGTRTPASRACPIRSNSPVRPAMPTA